MATATQPTTHAPTANDPRLAAREAYELAKAEEDRLYKAYVTCTGRPEVRDRARDAYIQASHATCRAVRVLGVALGVNWLEEI